MHIRVITATATLWCCFAFAACHSSQDVHAVEPTEAEQPEPAQDREPDPADSRSGDGQQEVTRLEIAVPNGWSRSFDIETNRIVLESPDEPVITVGFWPLEQASPHRRVYEIFEQAERLRESGHDIEPQDPVISRFDGVETVHMISVLTDDRGRRITLIDVAFPSSHPQVGIHVSGSWPESMNQAILPILTRVAQSVRLY